MQAASDEDLFGRMAQHPCPLTLDGSVETRASFSRSRRRRACNQEGVPELHVPPPYCAHRKWEAAVDICERRARAGELCG